MLSLHKPHIRMPSLSHVERAAVLDATVVVFFLSRLTP